MKCSFCQTEILDHPMEIGMSVIDLRTGAANQGVIYVHPECTDAFLAVRRLTRSRMVGPIYTEVIQ